MVSLHDMRTGSWLVIMLREPCPGRVKTRLAKEIGNIEAAAWYRRQSLNVIRRVGSDPRWTTLLAVSPDATGMASRVWPEHMLRITQGNGDLGKRMRRVFRCLPPGPVMVIGSDIPGVTAKHIAKAFQMLRCREAVFGPSPDGGYWLVGLGRFRRCPAGLLVNVRWSSRHALADSIASLRGRRVRFADTLNDIDTMNDLRSLRDNQNCFLTSMATVRII